VSERVERDDLNTPAIVTVGIVASVAVFAIIVALQAWFAQAQREEHQLKVVAPRFEELVGVVAEQQTQLHTYRWVDRQNGVVAIPIERAMELVARERQGAAAAAHAAGPAPAAAPAAPPATHDAGH
jgi:hypothetical protein